MKRVPFHELVRIAKAVAEGKNNYIKKTFFTTPERRYKHWRKIKTAHAREYVSRKEREIFDGTNLSYVPSDDKKIICENCGNKVFVKHKYAIKKGRKIFCSKTCKDVYLLRLEKAQKEKALRVEKAQKEKALRVEQTKKEEILTKKEEILIKNSRYRIIKVYNKKSVKSKIFNFANKDEALNLWEDIKNKNKQIKIPQKYMEVLLIERATTENSQSFFPNEIGKLIPYEIESSDGIWRIINIQPYFEEQLFKNGEETIVAENIVDILMATPEFKEVKVTGDKLTIKYSLTNTNNSIPPLEIHANKKEKIIELYHFLEKYVYENNIKNIIFFGVEL